MEDKFFFVYIIWGTTEDKAYQIASETTVSILSLRKHIPDVPIVVYTDQEALGFFNPFLKLHVDHIMDTKCDKYKSMVSSAYTYLRAVRDFGNFLYIDSDTIINRNFMPYLPDQALGFACHYTKNKTKKHSILNRTRRDIHGDFFRRYLGVKKYKYHPLCCLMRTNRNKDPEFWDKYSNIIQDFLNKYKQLVTYEFASISSRFKDSKDPNRLHRRLLNDEHFFAISLMKMDLHPRDFLMCNFHAKDNLVNISHMHGVDLSVKHKLLRMARKSWRTSGIGSSKFNYPRTIR